jgi:hypothetical protein
MHLWFEKSNAYVTVKFVICLKSVERTNVIKIEKWTSPSIGNLVQDIQVPPRLGAVPML